MKRQGLIFLLLNSSLWANNEALEVLTQIHSINSPTQDCSKMSNDELSLQCAHEVCGKPENLSVDVTAKNAHQYLSPTNQEKLKNLDSKLSDYYNKFNSDTKQYISELEKRASSSQFSDVSKWNDTDFQRFLPFFMSDISLNFDINAPLSQRKVKSITPDTHPYAQVHKEIAQNFSIIDYPFMAHQFGVIGINELRPLLSQRLEKIKQSLKSQNKTIAFNFDELQFGLSSGAKNDHQIMELFYQLEGQLQNQGIQTGPSLCADQCRKAIPEILKKFKISDFKNKQKEEGILNTQDLVALCKSSFINANIENTRFEEFKKIWPEVKAGYLKNVFPKYSDHSRKLLSDYLENGINFISSSPEKTHFPDLNQALKFNPSSYYQDSTASLVARAITPSYLSTHDPAFNCPIVEAKPLLWDIFASKEYLANNPTFRPTGTNSKMDNVLVSPFSCEHAGMGKGIIAHEVGHAITHVMSRKGMSSSSQKQFLNLRKCATDQWNKQPKTPLIYFKGDMLYTEEDTADLLSYMAVNDQKSFYGCGLLYPSDKGYKELGVNSKTNDNHSSGIVRLIREIQYKAPQRMPATCLEISKRNKDKFGKACF